MSPKTATSPAMKVVSETDDAPSTAPTSTVSPPPAPPAPPAPALPGWAKTGAVADPDKIFLYGLEGVGKTGFGVGAPSPIFLSTESGLLEYRDTPRLDEPHTWADVVGSLDKLRREPHGFRTLVVDTIDWLWRLIYRDACKDAKLDALGAAEYKRGDEVALPRYVEFLARVDALRKARGMEVILLAHAASGTFKNPQGADWIRYTPSAGTVKVAELTKQWADCVLFANYRVQVVAPKRARAGKATMGSETPRDLFTTWNPVYDAKNRHGLPEKLELEWDAFSSARARAADPEELLAACRDMIIGLERQDDAKIVGYVEGNKGNAQRLRNALNKLRVLEAERNEKAAAELAENSTLA